MSYDGTVTQYLSKAYHHFSLSSSSSSLLARKRQIYDQVGEEGLKRGGGADAGAHFFTNIDPHEIFKQFFGNSNPFGGPGSNPFDMMSGFMSGAGTSGGGGTTFTFGGPGGAAGGRVFTDGAEGMDFSNFGAGGGGGSMPFGGFGTQQKQDQAIERTIELSLEDLFHGCTKKMKISRKVLSADGTTSHEEKILTIDVKPGWKAGTKVTFPREGDQSPDRIPADIVFIIGEKHHDQFSRDGNDLRYKAKISLKQALCGGEVQVPRIDGKPIILKRDKVTTPDTEKVYHGDGMPISKHPGKRGDLIVSFDINFPTSLSDKDIKMFKQVLPD